jgi:hypothetical protein
MNTGNPLEIDPLYGLEDTRKPLRSKILAVPSLRAKYLQYVRTIAQESLTWTTLGPQIAQYRTLIDRDVKMDTRKLESYDDFVRVTADAAPNTRPSDARNGILVGRGGGGPGGPQTSLREFADKRSTYLLSKTTAGSSGTQKTGTARRTGIQ